MRNLSDNLTDLGYPVDTALDGYAALELARKKPHDIALLDLKMPAMDGLTLYHELLKLRSSTVAIVVTAYANKATAEEALTAGVWQVLAKPVDLERLLRLVDEALGQPLVLVVDDGPDLCASLWDLLRERGYRVAIAHDEKEAAHQLRESAFSNRVNRHEATAWRWQPGVPAGARDQSASPHRGHHRPSHRDGSSCAACAGRRS